MVDVVKSHGHGELIPAAFLSDEDQSVVGADPKNLIVGEGGSDPAELGACVGTFVRWNGKCMYQRIDKRQIPVSYINTTRDMTVPFDYQKDVIGGLETASHLASASFRARD